MPFFKNVLKIFKTVCLITSLITFMNAQDVTFLESEINNAIERCFGSEFDPDCTYIIAIQGPSTSGKSTVAKALFDGMKRDNGCSYKTALISLDNFYKNDPFRNLTKDQIKKYNFDSPAALNWNLIAECALSYVKKDKCLKEYKYNFQTKLVEEFPFVNDGINVLIFEGIFAHNIFNDNVFNIPEFDCLDIQKPVNRTMEYVKNLYPHTRYNYKLIKLFLEVNSHDEMASIRVEVDKRRERRGEEETMRVFNELILPSTKKWVECDGKSKKASDIVITGGSRNIDGFASTIKLFYRFFGIEFSEKSFQEYLEKLKQEE